MTKEEFLERLGQQYKTLRKKSGKTQIEVALLANTDQSTISSFENKGRGIESIDIIRRIVEATGHNISDLFETSEKKTTFTSSSRNLCPS